MDQPRCDECGDPRCEGCPTPAPVAADIDRIVMAVSTSTQDHHLAEAVGDALYRHRTGREPNREARQERRLSVRSDLLDLPISNFEMSVRSRNSLAKNHVVTIRDLASKTEAELLDYNFIPAGVDEVKDLLATLGLRLGMKP